jgi:NADH-quinone oxidoreductase subunit J
VSAALFLVVAALAVLAALTVVLHPNPVHSALGLVATLFLLSVCFVGLDAQLVAVLQVIVYAGAIVVLFLFVIMLLNVQVEGRALGPGLLVAVASAGGAALLAVLVRALGRAPTVGWPEVPAGYGETPALGERLFTTYLLPFELTSLLLLVAVVGAVAIARRRA